MPFLEQAARSRAGGAEARAWLAEALRRQGHHQAADSTAREALKRDRCHSFAHEVLATNSDPKYGGWENAHRDSSWHHLLAAVTCDSSNGSAWTGVWMQAMERGDQDLESRALRALSMTRFFTTAVLAFGRWLLRDLPQDALLIVNGDMDTYPLHVLQQSEGLRTDVVIANQSLLNLDWYRRLLRDRYVVRVPFDKDALDALTHTLEATGQLTTASDRMLRGWFEMLRNGKLGRPFTVSTTVSDPQIPPQHLLLRGAYHLVTPMSLPSSVDTSAIRTSLTALRASDFSGPFTSDGDRSPIRRVFSPQLTNTFIAAAVHHYQACQQAGQLKQAQEIQSWARGFAAGAGLDSLGRDAIERMGELGGGGPAY